MNKSEMIKHIAETANITQVAAQKAMESFFSAIIDTLNAGDKAVLVGFGSFTAVQRAERTVRNPRTGEETRVPAKKVIKFKAGKDLKDAVK